VLVLYEPQIRLVWCRGKKTMAREGGKVLVGGKFEDYKPFFDSLFGEARPFRPVRLAPLSAQDKETVRCWPAYPSEYKDLDYALRDKGWLELFPAGPKNHRFAAWLNDEIVGFTILTETGQREAEFYIALRPERLGQGL